MSFYKFVSGGGRDDDEPENEEVVDAAAKRVAEAVNSAVERCKVILVEEAEKLTDPRERIGVVQVAALDLFTQTIAATLAHPEPGRTMLAKGLYDAVSTGDTSLLMAIGALAHAAGMARDRGDGYFEIAPQGDE